MTGNTKPQTGSQFPVSCLKEGAAEPITNSTHTHTHTLMEPEIMEWLQNMAGIRTLKVHEEGRLTYITAQ